MKREKLIKRIFVSQMYEWRAVEEYLEEMALKGLLFVKATGILYYFRMCEPMKVRFAIDIFNKASMFDTKESNQTLEYAEYCKEAGWIFLYSNGKIQYFYTEEEDTIAIQTDDKTKFYQLIKMQLIRYLPGWILMFYMAEVFFISQLWEEDNYAFFFEITNGFMFTCLLLIACICLYSFLSMVRFIAFVFKNALSIRRGEGLKHSSFNVVKGFNSVFVGVGILLFLAILGTAIVNERRMLWIFVFFIGVYGVYFFIEFKRMQNKTLNRWQNIVIVTGMSIVFVVILMGGSTLLMFSQLFFSSEKTIPYQTSDGVIELSYSEDEVPMTLADLGIDIEEYDYIDSSAEEDSTIIASSKEYYYGKYFADEALRDGDKDISYEIFSTPFPWIMKRYLALYMERENRIITELDNEYARAWNAKKVYAVQFKPENGEEADDFDTTYYILYNNKVITLSGDFQYTVEEAKQIQSAFRKKGI